MATKYTLRQLDYFVTVAETGTVTAAAQRLHMSASALSTALGDLERSLGVELLVRHHARGVTLTVAGEQLLASARALLHQADDLDAAAATWGGGVTGTLPLGCFAILSPYVLPALLAAGESALPGLRIDPVEESLDGVQQGLLDGRFELALTYDIGLSKDIETTRLFTVPPHALLPSGHSLARRRSVRLADLADEPFVMLDLPFSRDYFTSAFTAAGVQPSVRFRTRSAETARALVGRGLAWTLLNLRPAEDVSVEGRPVIARPLTDPVPALQVVLARRRDARPTRRASALADLAPQVLK